MGAHESARSPRGYASGLSGPLRVSAVTVVLAVLVLLGVLARVYLVLAWSPALLGHPDSGAYLYSSSHDLFNDPLRVAGYVIFLRGLHAIWPHLVLVTITQHALGVVSALLLYDMCRRAELPRAVGLVPAAAVLLGGSELVLEHTVLTDPLFLFLTILGTWSVVRSWTGSPWWGLLAGVSLGTSIDVRTAGIEIAPLALLCLLLAPWAARGRRSSQASETRWGRTLRPLGGSGLRPARGVVTLVVGVIGVAALTLPYLAVHQHKTGVFNFTTIGNLQLYGRVAPFADCSKFTAPAEAADLCIDQPVARRPGPSDWVFGEDTSSPPYQVYGDITLSQAHVRPGENHALGQFAEKAIRGELATYVRYVARGLARVVDPSFSESPNPKIGNNGTGDGPQVAMDQYLDRQLTAVNGKVARRYYAPFRVHRGDRALLAGWERDTWIEGPAMAVLIVLALLSLVVSRGLSRRLAILLVLVSAGLVVGPVLVVDYSYRYVVPAFGPITGAAAIGADGICKRIGPFFTRRRADPTPA